MKNINSLSSNTPGNNYVNELYSYIFMYNPQAIAIADKEGYIIDASLSWCEMFGYEREEIIGCRLTGFRPAEDLNLPQTEIKSFSQIHSDTDSFEGVFLKKDGSKLWIMVTPKIIKTDHDCPTDIVLLYANAITGSKIQNTGRSDEIRVDVLLDQSPIGIVVYRTTTVLFANMAYAKMFGFDKPEEMTGITGFNLVSAGNRDSVIERNRRLEEGFLDTDIYEIECIKPNGRNFNAYVNTVRIIIRGKPATLGFLQDITERKRIEDDLKKSHKVLEKRVAERTDEINRLNQQVINSQEQERQRIARDLHDSVSQSILAAKVNLSIYHSNPVLNPDRLDRGLLLLDKSIHELREICADLFPAVLDEFGLPAATRLLIKDLLLPADIKVEQDICNRIVVKKETEINLYRIIQESFSNIIKHSGADTVRISLRDCPGSIKLYIEDNGTGFDPIQKMQSRNHCGLISMKQRAEGIGAILQLDSSPAKGTRITLILKHTSSKTYNMESPDYN